MDGQSKVARCNKSASELLTEHEPLELGERVIDWSSLDKADAFERPIYRIAIQSTTRTHFPIARLTGKLREDDHD